MKTILLPTDFSINSMNSIDFAVTLFKDVECDFYLLNVQKTSSFISDDIMAVTSSTTIYKTIIDAAKKSLTNIISKVKERYKNDKHRFHPMVDYDNFIDSIDQVSEKNQIHLIIMGTKGASGLQKVIFGSNTVRVIQRCKAPVLAIPDNCVFSNLSKVVFVTNSTASFSINDLRPLIDLVALSDSKLHVLHIADENHLAQKQRKNVDFFNSNFVNPIHDYIDIKTKDMYDIVHKYIIRNDIKMLCMIGEKHSFLERLFNKHLVETFAFNIDVPFLVMKNS
ncbi:universal stress protein [Flavivirga spongiicola]|uniref:Universal stress protein n=1 Tax=Flavivirga spongiicola TaxID=421621 RepID=A0ABU7XMA2_9FLAO|nr:universal stress protein [Flavivirga sp. MEBiC05379]MDO5981232.1 universal stress protein [Flavivirga sp. MEBiC05379]